MKAYVILDFLHVLLFAYWLGPDWGVFVCGRRVANPELSRRSGCASSRPPSPSTSFRVPPSC